MITSKDIECKKTEPFELFSSGDVHLLYSFDTKYYTITIGDMPTTSVLDIDLAVAIYNKKCRRTDESLSPNA